MLENRAVFFRSLELAAAARAAANAAAAEAPGTRSDDRAVVVLPGQ